MDFEGSFVAERFVASRAQDSLLSSRRDERPAVSRSRLPRTLHRVDRLAQTAQLLVGERGRVEQAAAGRIPRCYADHHGGDSGRGDYRGRPGSGSGLDAVLDAVVYSAISPSDGPILCLRLDCNHRPRDVRHPAASEVHQRAAVPGHRTRFRTRSGSGRSGGSVLTVVERLHRLQTSQRRADGRRLTHDRRRRLETGGRRGRHEGDRARRHFSHDPCRGEVVQQGWAQQTGKSGGCQLRVDQGPREKLLRRVETLDEALTTGSRRRRSRYSPLDESLYVRGLRPGARDRRGRAGCGRGRRSVGWRALGGLPGSTARRPGVGQHQFLRDRLRLAEAEKLLENQQLLVRGGNVPAIENSTRIVLKQTRN